MESTPLQKDHLRTIISKLIADDKTWFDATGIVVKDAGAYWMLNYNQAGGDNEYNRLVRGMVVQKPTTKNKNDDLLKHIKSLPFFRFFNRQETGRAAHVNFSNAEMLEKLDGTMVGVFFPNGNPSDPHWHTRKMLSAHQPDMAFNITAFHGGTYNFLPLIGSYVKKIPFEAEDAEYTYIFEFIHAASMVWTKYTPEQHGLYLIGGRNVRSHKELTEDQLDAVAKRLKISRPRRWDAVADDAQIAALMADVGKATSGFEGFIFRDRETGNRVKLKDADYVKFHHMLDKLSFKNLLGKVLEGEEDEILAYFPSAAPKVEIIKKNYQKFIDNILARIKYWRSQGFTDVPVPVVNSEIVPTERPKLTPSQLATKKELSQRMIGNKEEPNSDIRGYVFRYVGESDENKIRQQIDAELKRTALGHGKQAGSPRSVLDLIGIQDDSEDEEKPKDSADEL